MLNPDDAAIIQLADKLVRSMPRHPDVIALHRAICDRLATADQPSPEPPPIIAKPFDRQSYMRDYMRVYMKRRRANPFA